MRETHKNTGATKRNKQTQQTTSIHKKKTQTKIFFHKNPTLTNTPLKNREENRAKS